MIITRTPYRVSFFGGGSDYPTWYREHNGAVLATAINKYCYLLCRWLPPFFEHKHRIVYGQIELPNELYEIKHPSVRETLKLLNITEGVEIHHAGDLPARTGVGTSSAFTVGLLKAFYGLKKVNLNAMMLALEAIHVEQQLIGESVGSQDQVTAAFGGFNRIDFSTKEDNPKLHDIKVTPVKSKQVKALEKRLMLFFTGFSRLAEKVAKEQIDRMPNNEMALSEMYSMVSEGVKVLESDGDLRDFGGLLDEGWRLKRTLAKGVSTNYIDYLYSRAIEAGAIGGKLCGAGGGGFLLLFVEPENQRRVRESLDHLLEVPFKFESSGSKIIFSER